MLVIYLQDMDMDLDMKMDCIHVNVYIVRAYREIDICYIGTRYGYESRYEDRLHTCIPMSYVDTER